MTNPLVDDEMRRARDVISTRTQHDLPYGPLPGDVIVRQSSIGSWQLCPGRVGHSTDEGFIATPSAAMYRGTLAHAVIAAALLSPEGPMNSMPDRATVLALMDAIAPEQGGFHPNQVASAGQVDLLIDEIQDAYVSWYSTVYEPRIAHETLVAVERKLFLPLGTAHHDNVVWLQGTPDAVMQAGVFDWKTGGRSWAVNKEGLSKGSFGPQAPLYLALANHNLGTALQDFTFCVYAVEDRQWQFFPTRWDEHSIEAALLNALMVGRSIGAEAFPYTPFVSEFGKVKRGWHCSPTYCGAWNICPGKRMIEDGYDTEQVATAGW